MQTPERQQTFFVFALCTVSALVTEPFKLLLVKVNYLPFNEVSEKETQRSNTRTVLVLGLHVSDNCF